MGFKVIIIGAGLAGSLLANGLVKHGIEVEVYERDVMDSKREGYQIRLGSLALNGLHTCLEPDLCQDIISKFGRTNGQIYTTPILYDTNLDPLRGFGKVPPYSKSAPINRVVLRDALAEPLNQAQIVRYEKQYSRCEIIAGPAGRDRVLVFFEDGTTAEADVLVAADGSASKINREAGPDNIIERRERCGFIAKCQLPISKLRSLPREVRKGPIVIEENGVSFIASAYLPEKRRSKANKTPTLKAGEFIQIHSSISSDTSLRIASRRSISSDETDLSYDEAAASLMWNMNVPRQRLPEELEIDDPIQFVIDVISHWSPKIHDIIRSTPEEEFYRFYGRVGMRPEKNWREYGQKFQMEDPMKGHPRIWFLGDSIHPMLPTRAMGGNQAMCDAGDVCRALASLAKLSSVPTNSQLNAAVTTYEAAMFPRAFEWVEKSNDAGGRFVRAANKAFGSLSKKRSGTVSYRLDGWMGKAHLFVTRRAAEVDAGLGVIMKRMGFKKDYSEKEFDQGK